MVNFNAQDGYSVSPFQSPFRSIGHSSSTSSRGSGETHAQTSMMAMDASQEPITAAALSLPPTSIGSNGLQLQSHVLQPSVSILIIREVHFKHAGNYTCAPSNARPGTITIHVHRGK